MLCCHAKGGREGVQSTLGELLRVVSRGQLSRVETRMNEAAAREALGGSRQEVGASQHGARSNTLNIDTFTGGSLPPDRSSPWLSDIQSETFPLDIGTV